MSTAATILLVEDDTSLQEIYGERLKAEGYQIVTANNGEEALTVAMKVKPDLIISDVMMPKLSGFEMLDILRNTPEIKDTKVIVMTALGQLEEKQKAESLGTNKYLVKSQVTLEDMTATVHEVLGDSVQSPAPGTVATSPVPPVPPTTEPVAAASGSTLPTDDPTMSAPVTTFTPTMPEPVTVTDVPSADPSTVSPLPSNADDQGMPATGPLVISSDGTMSTTDVSAPQSAMGEKVITPLAAIESKPDIYDLLQKENHATSATPTPNTSSDPQQVSVEAPTTVAEPEPEPMSPVSTSPEMPVAEMPVTPPPVEAAQPPAETPAAPKPVGPDPNSIAL